MAPKSNYKKVDQREHVLKRPGLYIGGIHPDAIDTWYYKDNEFRYGTVRYSPGFIQTFLEILTNSVDHAYRTKVTEIKINIDKKKGNISVYNDGDGIDTTVTEDKIRGPELVFGHMLSSSNFDDENTRMLAGQNGIGSKATNIFSKKFIVETLDSNSKPKLYYKQEWNDNMSSCSAPDIEKLTGKQKPYTRIQYWPDFSKFHMQNGIDDDSECIMAKCVLDASAVTPAHTSVYLNGKKIPVKNFKDYCGLFVDKTKLVFDSTSNGDWEVAVACSPDGFRQVSFVNGLCTPRGGKHVDHVVTAIAKKLAAKLSTKTRTVTNRLAKNAMWIFVKANVPDPMFDSQNKHTLTTPAEKFKSRYEANDNFIKNITSKTGITDRISVLGMVDEESKLKKSDGSLKKTITGIPTLDDAIKAGTKNSHECTLYITEGMSARSTAIAGLTVIGREKNGVWCVKGKCLNVRDASTAKISSNAEIATLKKIIGLESGKRYATPEERRTLRYGSICILSDQDTDGFHIRLLIVNIFHTLWPELVKIGFVKSMNTPIVTAHKGKQAIPFYNIPDFDNWHVSHPGYSIRYRKGLGLATNEDARWFFKEMKQITYVCNKPERDPEENKNYVYVKFNVTPATVLVNLAVGKIPESDDDAIDLAFRKIRTDDRKEWLKRYDKNAVLDGDTKEVTLTDGVNKELAHFSHEDVARSLPSVVDGLKESQRKILYSAKLRPSGEEIRVAQMAAYVSQVSSYHHGEASLQGAIVGMAQTFVGTGNHQIMHDQGQFGSRLEGGKDAASSRYIHTRLTSAAKLMFPSADEPLLERALDDDRKEIEPVYYVPVLPVLLLNGSVGIATGWSTNVPCFSPIDIAQAYRDRLNGDEHAFENIRDLQPFYHDFTGTFEKDPDTDKWYSIGKYKKFGKTIEITELPVGTWTTSYKQFLEELCANPKSGIKQVEPHYTESKIKFLLHFDSLASAAAINPEDTLKLRSDKSLSTTNMHALDPGNCVEKYEDVIQIAETHFHLRWRLYEKRLDLQRDVARREVRFAEAREGFVADVIKKELELGDVQESIIIDYCLAKEWPKDNSNSGFDYLINMPISSLTKEKHDRLVKDLEKKREHLKELLKLTAEQAWLSEIDEVCKAMGY
ncbi:DNA topoisomerase 2 [Tetraselmis virus 1]|uniref:DNA topoisomerase 2 n=1 Tax=Tetraselmis virus 1 TaxID=2060617 RepID=A0A2P0VNK1_9VIRU|nr:DNA topoisomerase 2 [Tetraselmis virus 1]AUF82486.1 DNA topoisomerase 2 [Tetraselmis virus 1]